MMGRRTGRSQQRRIRREGYLSKALSCIEMSEASYLLLWRDLWILTSISLGINSHRSWLNNPAIGLSRSSLIIVL